MYLERLFFLFLPWRLLKKASKFSPKCHFQQLSPSGLEKAPTSKIRGPANAGPRLYKKSEESFARSASGWAFRKMMGLGTSARAVLGTGTINVVKELLLLLLFFFSLHTFFFFRTTTSIKVLTIMKHVSWWWEFIKCAINDKKWEPESCNWMGFKSPWQSLP